MRMKLLLAFMTCAMLGGCANPWAKEDLKSPCVGGKESPCERRPVNGPYAV